MKKLSILLGIILLCGAVAFGEEVPAEQENKQLVDVENSGGLLLFQKQPIYEKQAQIIRIRKSGGITIIQINGKVKDNADNNIE